MPTSDLLVQVGDVHISPMYRSILEAARVYSGDDYIAFKKEIDNVWRSIWTPNSSLEHQANTIILTSNAMKGVGLFGLVVVGFSMTIHPLKSHFGILAYEVYKPTVSMYSSRQD